MTAAMQKRLAWGAAAVALAVFGFANAHLIAAAYQSQPACVAVEGAAMPAKRAC